MANVELPGFSVVHRHAARFSLRGGNLLPSRLANLAWATGPTKLPMGTLLMVRVEAVSVSQVVPLGGGALHVSSGCGYTESGWMDLSGMQDLWRDR